MAVEAQEGSQLANELLERIGETVGRKADASTIFGASVQREGVTVIPVAKARFGFGGGGGAGTRQSDPGGEGSGGGGGRFGSRRSRFACGSHSQETDRLTAIGCR